jgi:acyl-coenzyme A thioesterase PaaI-like protein
METHAKGLSFQYKIPQELCRMALNRPPQVSASALLAVFDELSTYALMTRDKTCRGGVSIQLSAEILEPCVVDDQVKFNLKVDKAGKSIGFCSMEVLDANGRVIGRGKHIKFMPMGVLYDLLFGPVLLPFTVWALGFFADMILGRQAKEGARSSSSSSSGDSVVGVVGGMYRRLGLVEQHSTPAEASLWQIPEGSSVYGVKVKPFMRNLLGAMHGGAIASAVEEACYMHLAKHKSTDASVNMDTQIDDEARNAQSSTSASSSLFIKSIDVCYMSPAKGALLIVCTDDDDPYTRTENKEKQGSHFCSRTIGKVVNQKDQTVCAEFTCNWAKHC